MVSLLAAALLQASASPAVHERRCFLDPVWNASELYHDYSHPYGSAFNPELNTTQTVRSCCAGGAPRRPVVRAALI